MTATKCSLDWLTEVLEARGLRITRNSSAEARFNLPIDHSDGRVLTYSLVVSGTGETLSVAEDSTAPLLPRFCPDRHIVGDGGFCLCWEQEQRFDVFDQESASVWLDVLTSFLRTQKRAAYLRRWPTAEAWAHGVPAARAQKRAEQLGASIDPGWHNWILERRMTVLRGDDGVYRVSLDNEFMYSVWRVSDRRGKGGKQNPRSVEMIKDKRHVTPSLKRARRLLELAEALWQWQYAEERFWKSVADEPCCGTMDTCGLRKNECLN